MPVQFPAELPIEMSVSPARHGSPQLSHGELIVGRVTRVTPDGMANIKFANIEAQTRRGNLFQAGQRAFAHVQQTRDETVLSLLPGVQEGDIFSGTVGKPTQAGILARFDGFDFVVRPAFSETSPPGEGTRIRAQVQLLSGRPILQMLPQGDADQPLNGIVIAERADGALLIDVEGTILIALSDEQLEAGKLVAANFVLSADRLILQISRDPAYAKAAGMETESAHNLEQILARILTEPEYVRLLNALLSEEPKINLIGHELIQLLQQFAHEGERPAWILTLIETLEAVLIRPHEGNVQEHLPRAIENSGVFLESRLLQAVLASEAETGKFADLKLALLAANEKLSQLQQPPRPDGGELQNYLDKIPAKIGQLLDIIKGEQLHNMRMLPSNELYIQLPFAEASGLDYIEIRISHQGKRQAKGFDPKNILLTMAIATSHLGRVKATVSINNGQIGCRFNTNLESAARLLSSNADTLKQGLERLDYRVAYIDCALSKDEHELSVIGEPLTVPETGLDLQI